MPSVRSSFSAITRAAAATAHRSLVGFVAVGLATSACAGTPAAPARHAAAAEPTPPAFQSLPIPSPSPVVVAVPSPSPSPTAAPRPLALSDHPFAVMIDNISEARPQSGLDKADVVYEAPAEAGIPRLMPLFLRRDVEVERIGPVRSARHYFVYLANEYRTPLVHIGQSPQGYVAFSDTGLPDVDEIQGSDAFTRDRRREAPHNAFVGSAPVQAELQTRGIASEASLGGLAFGPAQPGHDPAQRLQILYPGGEHYTVRYDYDQDSKTYLRTMDGAPHVDGGNGSRYAARTVIVQYVDVSPIPNDDALRVDVQLVGSGRGFMLLDGTKVPLTWSKASIKTPTRFRRDDGAPFMLPEGQVWIQLVPLDGETSVS